MIQQFLSLVFLLLLLLPNPLSLPPLRGDANGDGQVTITDALTIAQYRANLLVVSQICVDEASSVAPPFNSVTITDALFIAQKQIGIRTENYLFRGDANLDGRVDYQDIVTIEEIILELRPPNEAADANGDGVVSCLDITAVEWIILGT